MMQPYKWNFILNALAGCMLFLSAQSRTEDIRLNQVGFYPDGPKSAIAAGAAAGPFYIVTPDGQDTLYAGSLGPSEYWTYSDEDVRQADFRPFSTPGTYALLVPGLGLSVPFDIKPRVHQEVARAAVKSYYFQRMSIDLTEAFAGKWQRPMGHPDTEVLVHSSAASPERPEGTVLSCPRGWYDAGDYNKYIVNSGISVYTLLAAYEHFPEYNRALETYIPESGDNIPDILDECLWNIRWMLTMQDPNDGGVYHKCSHANFSGAVMPAAATAPRYVVQKSSPAALNFAAVMAQTGRIFREFEAEMPGFADSCLTAALAAWRWARHHPDRYYRQNDNNEIYLPEITTGEYGDWNDDDEFQWASAELYITTGQDSFITAANPLAASVTLPGWNSVATLAYYSLAHHRKHLTAAVDTALVKTRLIQFADQVKAEVSRSAYHVMITSFPWGSNAVAANQAMAVLQAYELTGDSGYLEAAAANMDYMLGRNATTYCFVSGQGSKPPMHFHHRPSEADDVVEPVPGLIAGGPNPSQQDNCPDYPSNLPARSYSDTFCSYASNEICINWNAPLAYAAYALDAQYSPNGLPNTVTVAVTSPSTQAYFTTASVVQLSASASIEAGEIAGVSFYAGTDLIANAALAPYAADWQPAEPGVYEVRARAEGSAGDFRYSEPVTVIVADADPAGNVLFVVGDLNLNAGDMAVRNSLIDNAYQVTVQNDHDTTVFALTGMDVLLLSSTVGGTSGLRAKLADVAIPLMSWEPTLFDDLGWTGKKFNTDIGRTAGQAVDITDGTHPITSGFSGTVQVMNGPGLLSWGLPNANARIVAVLEGDPAKAAVFTYEAGDLLVNDQTAKARQVGFCFSDETAAAFTEAGWILFRQALEWAVSGTVTVVQETQFPFPVSCELFQNYPNPFNGQTRIGYQTPAAGNVRLSILNVLGQTLVTLIDEDKEAGRHETVWDGRDRLGGQVPSGVYLCRITVDTPQGRITRERKLMMIQ